ncbi:cation-transporting P-type ATPase [Streptomyces sp. NK08204]|uniref:cation-transporting P-type ATPase n=1 Tax=Streptomyces sp. NK08204 TaxID=2873260 RepID=UPI001CEC4540|nr:cation-transporting P-type ATPase [Streptomyces sp. NK08204]
MAREVVLLLETDADGGLSTEEAARRLERFGPDVLPLAVGGGLLWRVLRQFHHPLIYVLLAAGAVTAALGEYVDSAVIFGVVLVMRSSDSCRNPLRVPPSPPRWAPAVPPASPPE